MPDAHARLISRFAVILAAVSTTEVLTDRLCEASRQMLDAEGAAITLWTEERTRITVAATNDLAVQLEDLQDVVDDGPSIEAARRESVVMTTVGADTRYGLWQEHARGLDFDGTVLAVPLRADVKVLGVLTAHRPTPPTDEDGLTASFLGVTIATALLQDPQFSGDGEVHASVWPSRALIHQATGIVVGQVGVRPEDALALLRGQAFAQNTTLLDVAQQIIGRQINFRNFVIEGD